ncbi:DUF4160 domain-containing protein [Cupriavidus sp. SK-3]|uniref:DUF4160 domain-containing protein n=1 Tax=Cupriavidus sp. SK-3 TaxID=1470558 RepID=UPI00190F2BE9
MPTVLSIFGLRVVIYPNDHRPAHVHVMGKGCEAVFNLPLPEGAARIARELWLFGQGLGENRRRADRPSGGVVPRLERHPWKLLTTCWPLRMRAARPKRPPSRRWCRCAMTGASRAW